MQLTPVQRYCLHVLRLLRPGGAYVVLTCNHSADELVLMHAQLADLVGASFGNKRAGEEGTAHFRERVRI